MIRSARFALVLLVAPWLAHPGEPPTPAELYGELFEQVQLQRVFPDGKTFVDSIARSSPQAIMADYERARLNPDFNLGAFVAEHFIVPQPAGSGFRADPRRDVREHIDALWDALVREPDEPNARSSLLPLPYRYVVPGGRFREIYYWDSYFTMLGLGESGRHDRVVDLVKNFAHLVDRFGHVPNGNRTYYLSRSQPPFFAAMVNLVAARDGTAVLVRYLPQLEREYAFWMDGAERLPPGEAHRRVVRLQDGTLLNRYWDDRNTPREESYREDVETARAASRPAPTIYRNLRAAAESGWDFSSRWFADGRTLATIRTVDMVPVDLNSLLYHLEQTLARAYRAAGQSQEASRIGARAWSRRMAIHRYLWNPAGGFFTDYCWRDGQVSARISAATLYPLLFGVATPGQADQVAVAVRTSLLQPDGLGTTTVVTGEQWDAPNGWAPLQWIAIRGLSDYGHAQLAERIARRWIRENVAAYRASGKLVEKYDVTGDTAARGGEYPLQDGFGWTNGVLRKLLALYPASEAIAAAARAPAAEPGVLSLRPLAFRRFAPECRIGMLSRNPDQNASTARLAGAFSLPSRQAAARAEGASRARERSQCTLDSPRRR